MRLQTNRKRWLRLTLQGIFIFWILKPKPVHLLHTFLSLTHTHLSRCWVLPQQACRVIPTHSSTSGLSSLKPGCRQATTDSAQDAAAWLTDRLTVTWMLKRRSVVYKGNVTLTVVTVFISCVWVRVCGAALDHRRGSACYWQTLFRDKYIDHSLHNVQYHIYFWFLLVFIVEWIEWHERFLIALLPVSCRLVSDKLNKELIKIDAAETEFSWFLIPSNG